MCSGAAILSAAVTLARLAVEWEGVMVVLGGVAASGVEVEVGEEDLRAWM